jgi:hypothetical protein
MLFHSPFCIGFHFLAVARKGETDACRRGIAMAETIFSKIPHQQSYGILARTQSRK